MQKRSLSQFKTKTGFVGLVVFLIGAVRTILSLLQDFDYTKEHVGWVAGFIDTPLGNTAVTVLGVVLILWAIHRQQPEDAPAEAVSKGEATAKSESEGVVSQTTPADATPRREVDWKSLWFGIPTEEDARERLKALAAENERLSTPHPLIDFLAEAERTRTQLRIERDEAREEADALREELDEARQVSAGQERLPNDEELKRRSLELSEQLFHFLEDRANVKPETGTFSKAKTRHDEETKKQYSRRFTGEVAALLSALERRGWCTPEDHKRFESRWKTVDDRIRLRQSI